MELRVKQKSSFTRKLKLEQRKEGKQQRQGLASEKLWGETNPLIVSLSSIQSRACITQKVMSSRLSLTHGKRKTLRESSDSLKMLPRMLQTDVVGADGRRRISWRRERVVESVVDWWRRRIACRWRRRRRQGRRRRRKRQSRASPIVLMVLLHAVVYAIIVAAVKTVTGGDGVVTRPSSRRLGVVATVRNEITRRMGRIGHRVLRRIRRWRRRRRSLYWRKISLWSHRFIGLRSRYRSNWSPFKTKQILIISNMHAPYLRHSINWFELQFDMKFQLKKFNLSLTASTPTW